MIQPKKSNKSCHISALIITAIGGAGYWAPSNWEN